MLAEDSPFPPFWWGVSLQKAGVAARPRLGTYGRYTFHDLPPAPVAMTGDLEWLVTQPTQEKWAIGTESVPSLPGLLLETERAGLTLPPVFLTFLGNASLQQRIRSATGCFVDLGPVPVPAGDGYLIRFLGDQQGCLFWYLYVSADGTDHAVVCSAAYHGGSQDDAAADDDDEFDPGRVDFCGESFEGFLWRYWLENEIFFAGGDDSRMPPEAVEYLGHYRLAQPLPTDR